MYMLITIILAYLIGSISFAIFITKIFNIADPRTYGSKNPGATNVMRSGNKFAAILTLSGDEFKGLIVVIVVKSMFSHLHDNHIIVALSAIAVVLGHVYPIFFKFKGGKGVATALGVILGMNFYVAIILVCIWLLVFKIFNISSLAAIITLILSPLIAYIIIPLHIYSLAIFLIAVIVLYKHKANILRLINREEHIFKSPPK